jgi:hypothetical protein
MANSCFPQLTSGALVQYPFRKTRAVRNITNLLPDGTLVLMPDQGMGRIVWELEYAGLSEEEVANLEDLFRRCKGPLLPFTYIDPSDNMLLWSSDPRVQPWQVPGLLKMENGIADPSNSTAAFRITNTGQNVQELKQTVDVPSSYFYCFSFYARSATPQLLTAFRRGASTVQASEILVDTTWNRFWTGGQLTETGSGITVGLSLSAGQQLEIFGFQLEAQVSPSQYRPTSRRGSVYFNAHWAMTELSVLSESPGLFSTSVSVEASV